MEHAGNWTPGNFFLLNEFWSPFEGSQGNPRDICVCKLKKQREEKKALHLHLFFTWILASHDLDSDLLQSGDCVLFPLNSNFLAQCLVHSQCFIIIYWMNDDVVISALLSKPSSTISPNILFGLTSVIMDVISSLGEVICLSATCLPLDCPPKKNLWWLCWCLVKWNEVLPFS